MNEPQCWDDYRGVAEHGGNVLFPGPSFLALANGVDKMKRELFIQQCIIEALIHENGSLCIGEMK